MSNPNGLLSLVQHVGEENITVQVVHQSVEGQIKEKNGETKFTMVTESTNLSPMDFLPGQNPKKVGLILWVDTKAFEKWQKG